MKPYAQKFKNLKELKLLGFFYSFHFNDQVLLEKG